MHVNWQQSNNTSLAKQLWKRQGRRSKTMFVAVCWSILFLCSGLTPSSSELLRESPEAIGTDRERMTEISSKAFERASKFSAIQPRVEPSWPCPAQELIAPCTCEFKDANYEVNIDCSEANSENEIRSAFASIFPFDDVMYFTVNNKNMVNEIPNLTGGVFNVKTFGSVEFTGTTLSAIEDNVFDYSHQSLFSLNLSNNKLNKFPFQILDLYENLINLNLNNNELTELPIFYSSSLRVLSMNSNENLGFQATVDSFVGLPELRQLYLANIGLQKLVPDVFSSLAYISEIYLSENSLIELDGNAFYTPSPSVQMLYLANNMINTVRYAAITGLSTDGILDFTQNNITVLDRVIWEPIFEQVLASGAIILDQNPLTCGCDFKWIVNNDNYWNLISDGSSCYAGVLVSEIDKDFIVKNC